MLFDVGDPAPPRCAAASEKQAKEQPRKKWADLRSSVDSYLRQPENLATLEAFRFQMAALFEAMAEGRTESDRRPNISLRLIADGDPPAKVIVLPGFIKAYRDRPGRLNWCNQTIEILEETTRQTARGERRQFQSRLSVGNRLHAFPWLGAIYKSAMRDAEQIVRAACDFLDDRRAVLARNHDNCCICGRGLTDEPSRSRGIGPECIQTAASRVVLAGPEFIVPEPAV